MIKEILNCILRRKEVKLEYPSEFCIITLNDIAHRNGINDLSNKLIIRYKYNYKTRKIEVYRTYGYSDSLLYGLRNKLKLPIYDETDKEEQYPLYEEIDLSEVIYDKG